MKTIKKKKKKHFVIFIGRIDVKTTTNNSRLILDEETNEILIVVNFKRSKLLKMISILTTHFHILFTCLFTFSNNGYKIYAPTLLVKSLMFKVDIKRFFRFLIKTVTKK